MVQLSIESNINELRSLTFPLPHGKVGKNNLKAYNTVL
jgi:hypothetical protein